MGFLGDLGKAFVGQTPQQQTAPASQQGSGIVDGNGLKVIPHIELKDLRSHRQGEQLIVTAWVVNDSDQRLRIDSGYLLKQKRQFNQDLSPHQSHELTLYQGPAPHDESEHHAQIIYRLHVNGDVFQNNYRIDYHTESDGTRTVDQLHDDGPVRDV